ncbi:MAG: imidazole glycerol phosphate synthase subunit HisH [Clostridia bacterium]|nr:imidazole glycerol phosphate synthase subunit HisH [Clostridia bacterium]
MIAIIDYGVGNLFSLSSSFKAIGEETVITGDKEIIKKADKLVLPGVGAFGDAAKKLKDLGLDKVVKEEVKNGKPLLGVCLGMQMLFEKSYEYGEHEGLGILQGEVEYIDLPEEYKVPHIGWNALHFVKDSPILKNVNANDCVYFVHSFHVVSCVDSLIATTEYGKEITALVGKDNVYGCQFHPEKSGDVGLNILKAFAALGE